MPKANSIGEYFKEGFLREAYQLRTTDPLVTITPALDNMDGIAFQVITAATVRALVLTDTDSVVAATKTWTFANGAFDSGDVGATFVVTGSSGGTNDGTFTVASVTNATTIVSVEAPGGNETFDPDTVTVTFTDEPLQADITIEVSNDFVQATLPTPNLPANAGNWTDITDAFVPSIAAITADGSQYIQAYPLVARRARLTITATEGGSDVTILFSAKGNR